MKINPLMLLIGMCSLHCQGTVVLTDKPCQQITDCSDREICQDKKCLVVECTKDEHCALPQERCGSDFQCELTGTCENDGNCQEPLPFCDPATHVCSACAPTCEARCCGVDGCGRECQDTCGATGQQCSLSTCACEGVCNPICISQNRECGPDGCQGSCGTCADDNPCNTQGRCEAACVGDCTGKCCGKDACGNDCPDTCGASGPQCNSNTCLCENTCAGDCTGKECGFDGCSAFCGKCSADKRCEQGHCVPDDTIHDWYMAAANPQRTSWTPTEVKGNLQPAWYRPIDPYIPAKAQLILTNNTVYLSTASGLYALDAASGNLKWIFATELPLGNSPTVVGAVAYVGGMDHKLYAIADSDASSSLVWSFEVGVDSPLEANEVPAGFDTNPLVVDDLVIAGNRNGYLYAVDATNGHLAWKFKTGGGIHFSAAYKDGAIYIASDDSYAYAVQIANGQQIWKSPKLPVLGFHSWWPVIFNNPQTGKDTVVLVGSENYRTVGLGPGGGGSGDLENLEADEFIVPTYCCQGNIGPMDGPNGEMDFSSAAAYWEGKPYRRTIFVLDASTGNELTFDINQNSVPDYAPFFFYGTRSGMRYPVIVGGDSYLYASQTYSNTGQYSVRGQVAGWLMGTKWMKTPANATQANDEPMGYAAGGQVIYWSVCCDRTAGSFDVSDGSNWSFFSYNLDTLAPGYNIKTMGTFESNAVEVYGDSRANTGWDGQPAGINGVYGFHGDQNPPIPYNNMVYIHRGNAVIAFSAEGGASSLPLAPTVDQADPASAINRGALAARLETEVQKVVDAGHLRPGYSVHSGFTAYAITDNVADYFHNTGDTILALSRAYQHLSAELKFEVDGYLQSEYANYSPCAYVHNGWRGASRDSLGTDQDGFDMLPDIESYMIADPASGGDYPGWTYPPQTLYALWKYAQLAGGNAATLLSECSNVLEGMPEDSTFVQYPEALNAWIAGFVGYVELAKLAGQPYQTQQSTLDRLLSLRVSQFTSTMNNPYGPDSHNVNQAMAVARNFLYLTPELGLYLETNAHATVTAAFDLLSTLAPYWMAEKYEATFGESIIQPTIDYPALFAAKAWVMNATQSDLARYLDGPGYVRGDLFFINNLVTVLEAPARR